MLFSLVDHKSKNNADNVYCEALLNSLYKVMHCLLQFYSISFTYSASRFTYMIYDKVHGIQSEKENLRTKDTPNRPHINTS
jgi:hypothetical protein